LAIEQFPTASCQCGLVAIALTGRPIMSAICYCESCRTAGHAFEQAVGAPRTVDAQGGTDYCLCRKDRVSIVRGGAHLLEHRLTPDSKTRRVVATCCNAPMFLDFTSGHWLTLYRDRLPAGSYPPQMRVMTKDRPPGAALPDDIPRYETHAPPFMIRLLRAWAAMGFRRPQVAW
jgi:hypothetical protein